MDLLRQEVVFHFLEIIGTSISKLLIEGLLLATDQIPGINTLVPNDQLQIRPASYNVHKKFIIILPERFLNQAFAEPFIISIQNCL